MEIKNFLSLVTLKGSDTLPVAGFEAKIAQCILGPFDTGIGQFTVPKISKILCQEQTFVNEYQT